MKINLLKITGLLSLLCCLSCSEKNEENLVSTINWDMRSVAVYDSSLYSYSSYLPVYRQIYLQEDKMNHPLNLTISIRNPNTKDSLFLKKINYLNTEGQLIRSYLNKTVYLKPLETIDFGVADNSPKLGIGSSFTFEWAVRNPKNEALIEAVMIMTAGQQGISFTSKAIRNE